MSEIPPSSQLQFLDSGRWNAVVSNRLHRIQGYRNLSEVNCEAQEAVTVLQMTRELKLLTDKIIPKIEVRLDEIQKEMQAQQKPHNRSKVVEEKVETITGIVRIHVVGAQIAQEGCANIAGAFVMLMLHMARSCSVVLFDIHGV
eukprot:4083009-Amphidinium_carterae.1